MPRSRQESESGPMTLGQALAAHVRLVVWCKSCSHRSEPDVATRSPSTAPGCRFRIGRDFYAVPPVGSGTRILSSAGRRDSSPPADFGAVYGLLTIFWQLSRGRRRGLLTCLPFGNLPNLGLGSGAAPGISCAAPCRRAEGQAGGRSPAAGIFRAFQ